MFARSVSNDGTKFYFKTNKDAPQYRVVSYDIADPSKGFVDVIPEDKDAHLEDIKPIDQDKFVVVYKRNVSSSHKHLVSCLSIHSPRSKTSSISTRRMANS